MKTLKMPPQKEAPYSALKKVAEQYPARAQLNGPVKEKSGQNLRVPTIIDSSKNVALGHQQPSPQLNHSTKLTKSSISERRRDTFVDQLVEQKKKLKHVPDRKKLDAKPASKISRPHNNGLDTDSSGDDSGTDKWVYAKKRGGGKIF